MPVLRRRRRVRPVADTDGRAASPVPWIGMVLVVSAFFLYAASGVVAPWWGTVLMVLVWLALFALGCSWWSRHPRRLLVAGVAAYPLWFVLLLGGALLLGWET